MENEVMENESGTKKLRLYWRISVAAFIAMFILMFIVGKLNGRYRYSSWRVWMDLPVAIISFVMPILTLAKIGSLKKKNGGMPTGKTGGKKFLSIVSLIISFFIIITEFNMLVVGELATRNGRETISHSNVKTAAEDTVWSTFPVTDEFGDPIDGQYELDGLFQVDNDKYRTVAVAVTYNDEVGPVIVLFINNSVGKGTTFEKETFFGMDSVELKMKVGSDVYQYRLLVAGDAKTLYLMDYYSYVIGQSDAISEALTGGRVNEEKSLYDVKSIISLLYNGQEDIKSVISTGINNYSFTIRPANFRNAFDNIWDYSEFCAENE